MYARGGRARCITRVFRELLTKRGRALDDILAARDHLLAMPECSGRVGIVGFCMGGQFALVLSPRGFGATAPFYGTPLPRHLSETLNGACPIVASFGTRDPLGIGAANRLRKVTAAKNIPADIKSYPAPGTASRTNCPVSRWCASRDSATTRPRPKTRGVGSLSSSASTCAPARLVSLRYDFDSPRMPMTLSRRRAAGLSCPRAPRRRDEHDCHHEVVGHSCGCQLAKNARGALFVA